MRLPTTLRLAEMSPVAIEASSTVIGGRGCPPPPPNPKPPKPPPPPPWFGRLGPPRPLPGAPAAAAGGDRADDDELTHRDE
jgi:hypothetical protein